ncbi:MAG: hypothetical protein V4615_02135 [Bacteroidota bacterium]
MSNLKYAPHIFLETLIASFGFVFFGCYLVYQYSYYEKSDYKSVTGKLNLFSKTFEDLPFRHHGQTRFLRLDNYPKVFQIYIGKEDEETTPKFEKIDSLSVGDSITVFYSSPTIFDKEDSRISNYAVYIDKGSELYFERNRIMNLYVGYFVAIVGVLLFGAIILLRQKGVIE